jgi:biopolymer transport protein ExbD
MGILQSTILKNDNGHSVIGGQSILNPTSHKEKPSMLAVLVLTSLIDAFTILVSYLLMSATIGAETLDVPQGMVLPSATKSDVLEKSTVLMVHNDQYFINNEPIRMDQIGERLLAIKKTAGENPAIVIQADRKTNFMKLNPIVLSGLQAGFAQIRFAVKQEDSN